VSIDGEYSSKIFDTDLSVVPGDPYTMALPRPRVTCRRYIWSSPSSAISTNSITADEYDRYLSSPTDPAIVDPFGFCSSQHPIYPTLSTMALGIHSIPAMTAGVRRLFSHCKLMVTNRRNRLHIDGLHAVDCVKSWDKLAIGLPHVIVTGAGSQEDGMIEDNEGDMDHNVE
jgi:hypothetical protein